MHETSFTGGQIIRLQSVDSTNNYAARLVKEVKPPEGTVIMAHEQVLGKGQMGNTWYAQPGKNLTFSLILYPKYLNHDRIFIMSQVTALAVSDLLMHYGIDNQVKWPNDIITSKGKICGILIENQLAETQVSHAIVGVGINVNQHMDYSAFNATSMIEFTGEERGLDHVLTDFCRFFDKWYLLMTAQKFDLIHNSYLLRLLHFGKKARYRYQEKNIEATIVDVEKSGKLKLRDGKDEFIYADLKEITFLL